MKRYEEDRVRTQAKWRRHLKRTHDWPTKPVDCICELQAGRFRKRHALGCNKTRCMVCKYEKLMGVPTKQDLIERDRMREQIS